MAKFGELYDSINNFSNDEIELLMKKCKNVMAERGTKREYKRKPAPPYINHTTMDQIFGSFDEFMSTLTFD